MLCTAFYGPNLVTSCLTEHFIGVQVARMLLISSALGDLPAKALDPKTWWGPN